MTEGIHLLFEKKRGGGGVGDHLAGKNLTTISLILVHNCQLQVLMYPTLSDKLS